MNALKTALLATTFFGLPLLASAETHLYTWKVLRVIDGDTVEIEAPYLPAPLKPSLSIRVYGVDTPEKGFRAKCEQEAQLGKKATEFTTAKVQNARDIQVSLVEWDKFGGRVLGDVLIDGHSLTEMLIEEGFARPYHGEAKKSWCE